MSGLTEKFLKVCCSFDWKRAFFVYKHDINNAENMSIYFLLSVYCIGHWGK